MALFKSSTKQIPETSAIPKHIAIIMDGNGRWAKQRLLPRIAGHRRGVETLREVIKASIELGVEYLTLFAFSSENWRRPPEEISLLMQLFLRALEQEVAKLHANDIRFKVIGDVSRFEPKIVELIRDAEALTLNNQRLTLTIAANYGGRWDILEALRRLLVDSPEKSASVSEEELAPYLSTSELPEPDFFIRTGGEQRISNFLLWQLAYTELYFTDTLWPDFNAKALHQAVLSFQQRERRFGRTSEQLIPIAQSKSLTK